MPWITTESGKHINTDWFDKDRQIAANQSQAKALNEMNTGVSDDYIVTAYPPTENQEKRKAEYITSLKKLGVFGSEEQIDSHLKNTELWHDLEDRAKRVAEDPRWGYRKVTAGEFAKLSYVESSDTYMSFEEYKKYCFTGEGERAIPTTPGSLSEGLRVYYSGASKNGYGQYTSGAGARKVWDDKYHASEFIDSHKEVQLNTTKPVYRGLRLSDKSMEALRQVQRSGDSIDMRGPSSWTMNEGTANRFAEDSLKGQRNQNLVIFEDTTKGLRKAMPFIYGHDSEVLYSGSCQFTVVSIETDSKGVHHVKVKSADR